MAFAITHEQCLHYTITIEEGFSLPKMEQFKELINERTEGNLI